MTPPAPLLIAGCGLLGSSVAMAWRRAHPQAQIVGVEPSDSHRQGAPEAFSAVCASIHEAVQLLAERAGDAIGIAATPPAELASTVRALAPHCALVLDVGSIKTGVVAGLGAAPPANFVPCHPMAGSHRRGPAAGVAELFDRRWVFVTPLAGNSATSVAAAEAFWQTLGARTRRIEPAAHDAAVAYTSHLPHLLAAAYMALDTPDEAAAGTGFMEFTRLAKANPQMWSQVLLANAAEVRPLLARFRALLEDVDALLAQGDEAVLYEYLSSRAAQRSALDIPEDEAHSLV